jgi:hypothetical protein
MAETIPIEKIDSLFTGLVLMMPGVKGDVMLKAAIMVENEAKRVIGTYDYGWPRLSPATIKAKGADTPVLDTGELQASIEYIPPVEGDTEVRVGSNNPKRAIALPRVRDSFLRLSSVYPASKRRTHQRPRQGVRMPAAGSTSCIGFSLWFD